MATTPSPAGVLTSGFEYQHTFTWLQALRLLQNDTPIVKVGFEVPGAGNVDDVVVYYAAWAPKYHQVKYAQRIGELMTYEWFMEPMGNAKKSLLQRLYESFEKLTADGVRPSLALETNRWPDPSDPLLVLPVSGRAYKLMPYVETAPSSSDTGKARRAWADHLGVTEPVLFEFLSYLEINPMRGSLESLRESCRDLQASVQIRPDDEALDIGVAEFRRMIGEGIRGIDAAGMRELIERRRIGAGQGRALLAVQAVDYDPWPEAATQVLDWVQLFAGEEPGQRCQLHDPVDWNDRLKPDLQRAVAGLRRQGVRDVTVRGFIRLPTAFAVGFHFSERANFSVAMHQYAEEWASEGAVTEVPLDVEVVERGKGDELAIGISIANDVSSEVLPYLEAEGLPARRFVNLRLHRGPGRRTIGDAAEARGLTQAIRDAVDQAVRTSGATRVHLFLSTPVVLGLLVGHSWGRVSTVVYEHRGTGQGYFPTFDLPA
jgi:hypothetical protein